MDDEFLSHEGSIVRNLRPLQGISTGSSESPIRVWRGNVHTAPIRLLCYAHGIDSFETKYQLLLIGKLLIQDF